MATILDVGILNYFLPVFVFMLVTVIMWALLEKINFFGGNKFANLLIAFVIGILFILVPELTTVISLTMPWFAVLIIFLLFTILIFLFMGVKADVISGIFGNGTTNQVLVWSIIIICIAIFGYAFTQVYGEQIHSITAGEVNTDGTTTEASGSAALMQNVGQIIFTPKVMGAFFLLLMATFIVRFISANVT